MMSAVSTCWISAGFVIIVHFNLCLHGCYFLMRRLQPVSATSAAECNEASLESKQKSIKGSFIVVFIAMTFFTLNCRARLSRAAVKVMLWVGKQAESGTATCLWRASQTSRGEIKLIFSVNTCGAAPLKPPQVYKYYRFFLSITARYSPHHV